MMAHAEMTDAEVRQQVALAEAFIAGFREAIAAAMVVNPACADAHRRGLARIAATVDQVDYVTMCNLANLDAAWRGRLRGSMFMSVIEVYLMGVGCGPTLDYADATAFLAEFQPLIDMARKRWLQ